MKKVYIIHGWDGHPEEGWFPWLQNRLQAQGVEVVVPQMPDTSKPKIETWVNFLSELVKEPDGETYFVGHSIGVQTILRYLSQLEKPVAGVLSVAGFYELSFNSLNDEEEKEIARPWLKIPIDNERVRKNVSKITAIFSDNDPFVPLNNVELFKSRLGAKTRILHNQGHIGGEDNIKESDVIWNELIEIMEL